MADPKKLVARFGTQAQLARAIGVGRSTVWMWLHRGRIPSRHWPAIAAAARRQGITLTLADLIS